MLSDAQRIASSVEYLRQAASNDTDKLKAQRMLKRLLPLTALVQINDGRGWNTIAGFDSMETAVLYAGMCQRIAEANDYRAIATTDGV
jgi:hypothetical protein